MKIKDERLLPYEIWQDDRNFTVGIPKAGKDGIILLSNPSYFTSLAVCLMHIARLQMIKEDVEVNLDKYISKYESIKNEFLKTIQL